jgi:hypothetical protein
MGSLSQMPLELLENIFIYLDPLSLVNCSSCWPGKRRQLLQLLATAAAQANLELNQLLAR